MMMAIIRAIVRRLRVITMGSKIDRRMLCGLYLTNLNLESPGYSWGLDATERTTSKAVWAC